MNPEAMGDFSFVLQFICSFKSLSNKHISTHIFKHYDFYFYIIVFK